MNLLLLEPGEAGCTLPGTDPRIRHALSFLGAADGRPLDAAVVGQAIGKLCLRQMPGGWRAEFEPLRPAEPAEPGSLLCGLCRPQTVRKIVAGAAQLGIREILFFPAERSEPSYAQASLWKDGELGRLLRESAQQTFTATLPEVRLETSLEQAMRAVVRPGVLPVALDNYEAAGSLAGHLAGAADWAIAAGPERGWSAAERALLRASGWQLASLGKRVLRLETAALAALAVARSGAGLL